MSERCPVTRETAAEREERERKEKEEKEAKEASELKKKEETERRLKEEKDKKDKEEKEAKEAAELKKKEETERRLKEEKDKKDKEGKEAKEAAELKKKEETERRLKEEKDKKDCDEQERKEEKARLRREIEAVVAAEDQQRRDRAAKEQERKEQSQREDRERAERDEQNKMEDAERVKQQEIEDEMADEEQKKKDRHRKEQEKNKSQQKKDIERDEQKKKEDAKRVKQSETGYVVAAENQQKNAREASGSEYDVDVCIAPENVLSDSERFPAAGSSDNMCGFCKRIGVRTKRRCGSSLPVCDTCWGMYKKCLQLPEQVCDRADNRYCGIFNTKGCNKHRLQVFEGDVIGMKRNHYYKWPVDNEKGLANVSNGTALMCAERDSKTVPKKVILHGESEQTISKGKYFKGKLGKEGKDVAVLIYSKKEAEKIIAIVKALEKTNGKIFYSYIVRSSENLVLVCPLDKTKNLPAEIRLLGPVDTIYQPKDKNIRKPDSEAIRDTNVVIRIPFLDNTEWSYGPSPPEMVAGVNTAIKQFERKLEGGMLKQLWHRAKGVKRQIHIVNYMLKCPTETKLSKDGHAVLVEKREDDPEGVLRLFDSGHYARDLEGRPKLHQELLEYIQEIFKNKITTVICEPVSLQIHENACYRNSVANKLIRLHGLNPNDFVIDDVAVWKVMQDLTNDRFEDLGVLVRRVIKDFNYNVEDPKERKLEQDN